MAMRLPILNPEHLGAQQRDLYDDMVDVIDRSFGDLIARLPGGALVGPSTPGCISPSSDAPPGP